MFRRVPAGGDALPLGLVWLGLRGVSLIDPTAGLAPARKRVKVRNGQGHGVVTKVLGNQRGTRQADEQPRRFREAAGDESVEPPALKKLSVRFGINSVRLLRISKGFEPVDALLSRNQHGSTATHIELV